MTHKSGTLDHSADLGLWVEAEDLNELFAGAPVALAELMVQGPRNGQVQWLPFAAQGADRAELLVALLAEVVYLWDGEGLLVVATKVRHLSPESLEARLGVIPADPARHQVKEPVKAVTYHQASVERHGRSWRAQVILDL